MRLSYERKLFSLAMTEFIFNSNIPEDLKPKCGIILREIVCCLMRQQRIEQMQAKKSKKVNPMIDNILDEQDYKSSGDEEEKKESSTV